MLPAGGGDAWAPDQQAAPPAGQPWGQPWGPGQQPPAQQPPAVPGGPQTYGQGAGHPAAQSPAPQGPAPFQQPAAPQPLPPQDQGFPPQDQGFPQPAQGFPPPAHGQPPMPAAPPSMSPQAPQPGAPAAGALPPIATAPEAPAGLPFGGQPGQPGQHGQPAPGALPPQQPPYAEQPTGPSGELVRATPQTGAPLPPVANASEATTVLPPVSGGAAPPVGDAATQMLRPIKAHQGPPRPGQPLPQSQPMPGSDGSEATQLIPPVGGAAGAGMPTPPPGGPFGGPPGAPADRPTPAEFDGLFRDGPGVPGTVPAPDATAQLPRFDDQARPPYGGQPGPGGPFAPAGQDQYASYDDDGGGGRRKLPPAAIIGGIVVVLAGVGLGVGWVLSGGSDDGGQKKDPGTSAAKSAKDDTSKPAGNPAGDPAEGQAKGLDALLADSNNSRSAVIGAVQNIKTCTNLDGAANDLRSAAGQRNDLIKRLQQLPVDQIPNNAQLTAALTKAWQSSAAADNHYAAWADKTAGKGGCDKGHAKGGKEPAQGNAASGAATQAKQQAAALWNPIAQKYHLREHQPEQL